MDWTMLKEILSLFTGVFIRMIVYTGIAVGGTICYMEMSP